MPPPVVIVGAGLAGASAALVLSRTRAVTVVEAVGPAAGASGAAAGLANPFMGPKAKPAWRHDAALDALAALADEAGVPLRRTGVVRPAGDDGQARVFAERAAEHADLDWLAPGEAGERFPLVSAPHGALWVRRGGSLDVAAFVEGALAAAQARGGRVVSARPTSTRSLPSITGYEAFQTLLAPGDGLRQWAEGAALPLHRVKGQTVRVARPAALAAEHPAVAGAGYVVPTADGVVVGATFEHRFDGLAPDPALDAGLVARAARMVPALGGAAVIERRAGVRLTVPSHVSPRRLPLAAKVGPGVFVVSGLGAKGLLTAPLIATMLPDALDGRRPLPPELWPV